MTFYPLEKAFLFVSQLKLLIKIRAEITKVKNCSVASKNSNNFYKENNLTNFFPVASGRKTTEILRETAM